LVFNWVILCFKVNFEKYQCKLYSLLEDTYLTVFPWFPALVCFYFLLHGVNELALNDFEADVGICITYCHTGELSLDMAFCSLI